MAIGIQELSDALAATETKAESVVKLAKLLKQAVELYAEFTGSSMSTTAAAGAGDTGASPRQDAVLQLFAEQWSQLPADTRQKLMAPVRVEAKDNNVLFVRGMIYQMSMLASMMHPVTYLANLVGKVIQNQERIIGQLETITQRLKDIEMRLDEQTLVKARKAIRLLNDAANIDDKSIVDQKLNRADDIFSELTELHSTLTTQGSSGTVQNRALIALGYWGRHLILGMQNQTRFALIQVYECTQKYPLEGMMVFPAEYFSKDYKAEIDSARRAEEWARTLQSNAQNANAQSQVNRGLEIAGGVAKIGFGLVGIFHGAGGMIGDGWEDIQGRGKGPVRPQDVVGPRLEAESMRQTQERLVQEITKECGARLQLLGSITVGDLRKIIVAPMDM